MEEESTRGTYEGMIEAAEQWTQLLARFEKEQMSDSEKEQLIREYFQIPEEESLSDFFQIPRAEPKKRTMPEKKREK